jgi:HrpA-like RNA helicase
MGKKNRRNRRKQRFLEKKSSPYINKYNNSIISHKKKKNKKGFSPPTAVYDTKSDELASISSQFSPIKEKGNASTPKVADGLPILAYRKQILKAVRKNPTIILVGETGSGKTTQTPQYLYEKNFASEAMIAITQPRRVAAMTVAKRVAEEMKTELGTGTVGYAVRFDDCTSINTSLKYLTDGLLLREALIDPMLSRYSVIILDEAHERTLQTDILFGVVKRVQLERNSRQNLESNRNVGLLRVIVMSATLQTELFSKYFDNAPVMRIPGRTYPIDIYYTSQPVNDYLDAALTSVLQIHLSEGGRVTGKNGNSNSDKLGDILVFLTGQEDIDSLCELLKDRAKSFPHDVAGLMVRPIYASLPWEKQAEVFEKTPRGFRKIVVATNIAETSITIDGIRYVVDAGLVKMKGHHMNTGMEYLRTVPVSKAQAWQRSGRSGRQSAGKCYRLYPEPVFEALQEVSPAEIHRCSLASVVLNLKALGINDVLAFDFVEKPKKSALLKALNDLALLNAIKRNKTKDLTPIGKKLVEFPLEPIYGLLILKSCEEDTGCTDAMLTIVSMLSSENIFVSPMKLKDVAGKAHKRFAHETGDHLTLLNIFEAYKQECRSGISERDWCRHNYINGRALRHAIKVRSQLLDHVKRLRLKIVRADSDEVICKCLVAGCYTNTARFDVSEKDYLTLIDKVHVSIHPSSVLFRKKLNTEYILYDETIKTKKKYMRCVTTFENMWLKELAGHCFS